MMECIAKWLVGLIKIEAHLKDEDVRLGTAWNEL